MLTTFYRTQIRGFAHVARAVGPNDTTKINWIKKKNPYKYGLVKKWWDTEAAVNMKDVEGLKLYRNGFSETELGQTETRVHDALTLNNASLPEI
jgi:hypothetical protein